MPMIRQAPRKTVERWEVLASRSGKRIYAMFATRDEAEAFAAQFEGRRRGVPRSAAQVSSILARRSAVDGNGCHVWTGALTNVGYPRLTWSRGGSFQKESGGHRLAYILARGEIPDGFVVDHICRNRACVNPAHLEVVDQRTNIMRSPIAPAALNAAKTHCPQRHPYDGVNTYVRPGTTTRICRTCQRDHHRRYRHARRAQTAVTA